MNETSKKRKRENLSLKIALDNNDDEFEEISNQLQELEKMKFQLKKKESDLIIREQTLEKNKQAFEALYKSCSNDKIIKLNVGGKIIHTYRSTLGYGDNSTFLSAMFSEGGRWEDTANRDGEVYEIFKRKIN